MAKRDSRRKKSGLGWFGLWPHQRQIGVLAGLLLVVCLLILGAVYWMANTTYFMIHR